MLEAYTPGPVLSQAQCILRKTPAKQERSWQSDRAIRQQAGQGHTSIKLLCRARLSGWQDAVLQVESVGPRKEWRWRIGPGAGQVSNHSLHNATALGTRWKRAFPRDDPPP